MPAQLFSFSKPDGSAISGTQVEGRVIEIFQKEDILAKYGLLYPAPAGAKQIVRIPAPVRVVGQNYSFSADDSGVSPDTIQSALTSLQMDKFAYGSFISESLDDGLWTSTGEIRTQVMKSLGQATANSMLVDYIKTLANTLVANKATQMFELPANAKSDNIDISTATSVVKEVQRIIRNYRTSVSEFRVGLPDSQIRLLASYEFIDIYANCLSVLGRKPEYIESKFVEGQRTLSINGIELLPFWPLRQNLTAGDLHKTKSVNATNFYLIALSLPSFPFVKGNVEIFSNKNIKQNNLVNGTKGVYGFQIYDQFKLDIFAIVDSIPTN